MQDLDINKPSCPKQLSSKPRRYFFSLIELLVVIAIMATLISLLQPSLNSIIAKASGLECLTRMKLVYADTFSYLGDHGDLFPPTISYLKRDPSYPKVNSWQDHIYNTQDEVSPHFNGFITLRTAYKSFNDNTPNAESSIDNRLICTSVKRSERPPVPTGGPWDQIQKGVYSAYASFGINSALSYRPAYSDSFINMNLDGAPRYLGDQIYTDGVLFTGGFAEGIMGSLPWTGNSRYTILPQRHDMMLEYMFLDGHVSLSDNFYFETQSNYPWKLRD
jgi:type II secretory pathway pseudopilin PulG